MSEQLLIRYIRLAVNETHLARVPNQLVSDGGHEDDDTQEEDVNEFSACGGSAAGGIQGFTAPLGSLNKKNKRKR